MSEYGMIPQWANYCGICGSHEDVWLIDYMTPWKYVDGIRKQAPNWHDASLRGLSYEQREDVLSTIGHTGSGVWCTSCIALETAKEPYIKDGVWHGTMKVTRYAVKMGEGAVNDSTI